MKHYANTRNRGQDGLLFRLLSHISFFYLYADFPAWHHKQSLKTKKIRKYWALRAVQIRLELFAYVKCTKGSLKKRTAALHNFVTTALLHLYLLPGAVLQHSKDSLSFRQNFDSPGGFLTNPARRSSVYVLLALVPCFVFWHLSMIAMAFSPDFTKERLSLAQEEDETSDIHTTLHLLAIQPEQENSWPVPQDAPLFRASVCFEGTGTPWENLSSAEREDLSGLVLFDKGNVIIRTEAGNVTLTGMGKSYTADASHALLDPFQIDMFSTASDNDGDIPPLLYGEETDAEGIPRRWKWQSEDYLEKSIRECSIKPDKYDSANLHKLMHSLNFPSKQASFGDKRDKYQEYIKRYAERYDLAVSLMLAIMHTESGFNPYAVSNRQAIGLMQIVPRSAGIEVYSYLKGRRGKPSHETLFNPENNILYGAVYLHMLSNNYFGSVANEASRQMLTIAAYNGGPNAVLRLFAAKPDRAVARINRMSPQAVYRALTVDMPFAETRRYVQLVLGRIRYYSSY
jgi:Soluble lytic murein transglycosylase and related regulatory proteins (some contain LysM/invasin domains)